MGDYAILEMVEDSFYNHFLIIDIIDSNNDSTIIAVLKHPSKGDRGQVLKLSKGKLDEEIPEPSLLADPSYRVKFVAKHIFSIVNEGRDQQRGCTKADSLRLNKYWGYTIKNNRKKTIEEFSEASKVPLEHMFNNRDNFSADWLFKTRASSEGKTYNDRDDGFCCKKTTTSCPVS